MTKISIKKGDTVEALTGKDRGKRGKIVRVLRGEGKVIVEGLNKTKKHKKATRTDAGQIVELDAPMDISNVMLYDETAKKRTRTFTKVSGDKKIRISKQTNNEI